MKKLKFKRLSPTPLSADPAQFGFGWLLSWLVIDIEGHPVVSGLCNGAIWGALPVLGFIVIFQWVDLKGEIRALRSELERIGK